MELWTYPTASAAYYTKISLVCRYNDNNLLSHEKIVQENDKIITSCVSNGRTYDVANSRWAITHVRLLFEAYKASEEQAIKHERILNEFKHQDCNIL